MGVAVVIAGAALLRAAPWGRAAGLFIPYHPLWSISVMALDLIILWGLARLATT
ncbi:hypothetical protein AB0P07_23770 [Streptomyces sp. NPDC085944]|uniref:hypothetical protein n=1 Tax=Streptomyces sp. NPDC085944 TaxID=3154962 RepID=UPI00343386A7